VNYKEYKSDYLKEKYLTKIEVFDTNGNKLDPSHYENFSWFQPKVKMKKEKL
jgi:hypothetical protein